MYALDESSSHSRLCERDGERCAGLPGADDDGIEFLQRSHKSSGRGIELAVKLRDQSTLVRPYTKTFHTFFISVQYPKANMRTQASILAGLAPAI
jgi:hypothetical protein